MCGFGAEDEDKWMPRSDVAGRFWVVQTGMVILLQEEGHDWSEVGPGICINAVEDSN